MKLSLQINEIYALELDSSSAVHVLYQLVLVQEEEEEEGLLRWYSEKKEAMNSRYITNCSVNDGRRI